MASRGEAEASVSNNRSEPRPNSPRVCFQHYLEAFEMRCWRKALRILWMEEVTVGNGWTFWKKEWVKKGPYWNHWRKENQYHWSPATPIKLVHHRGDGSGRGRLRQEYVGEIKRGTRYVVITNCRPTAVSYTHLDVYKRQVILLLTIFYVSWIR